MNQRIIYTQSNGVVAVVIPTGELSIDQVLTKDVPASSDAEIVDISAIPSDRTFRGAWIKSGKTIGHNIPKVKEIAHAKRRARREVLFAPHDAVIMKQIPGKDATAAEQARKDIRVADSLVQETINNSTDVNQIKSALAAYGALNDQT